MSAWRKSVPSPVIYLQKRHKLDIISEIAAEKHAYYAVLSVLRQSTFFLRIFRFGNPMEVHFMKRKPFFSARNIAYLAVLTALLIVLQLFASAIPMFGVHAELFAHPHRVGRHLLRRMGRGAFGAHLRASHLFGDCRDGQGTFYRILLSGKPRHPDDHLHRQDDCRRACCRASYIASSPKKSAIAASYVAAVAVALLNTGLYLLGVVLHEGRGFSISSARKQRQRQCLSPCLLSSG